MKTMHLFAGGGGGILADLILGHDPIVAVEWDKYACEILRARVADGWFTGMSVWEGDVRLFNPSEYKGQVDIIHAGFPCQDISQAGKQAGLGEGTRSGLYREVLRIAGVVRPKIIFMENVSAILSNGLGTVLADLAEMGYDSRYCCIRASDVGAPHQRDRWWLRAEQRNILAHAEHQWIGWWKQQQTSIEKTAERVANTRCELWQKRNSTRLDTNSQKWTYSKLYDKSSSKGFIPNTSSIRLQRQREQRNSISTTQERQMQTNNAQSNNATWWEVESSVGRLVDGMADWSHQLKALGNGQVPLQAAVAFRLLEGRA